MTLHASDAAVTREAKQLAKKRSRKYVIIGGGLATLLTAGGAWAAMSVFGTGSAGAEAYEAQQLTVTNGHLSKDLYPGASANLLFNVANNNPFPVKVQKVTVDGALTNVTCDAATQAKLSGLVEDGKSRGIAAADQVEIPAGGNANITVPDAVRLALSSTEGCGFTVNIKVDGKQSGGDQQPAGDQ